MMRFLTALLLCGISAHLMAQCGTGEVEVYIKVTTDQYGHENYWELLPDGNGCGSGTIFAGGNSVQVGCNGANGRDASPGNGYGSNAVITEGPFCLVDGNNYQILSIDDWADGGTAFAIEINGFEVDNFVTSGGNYVHSFTANGPAPTDAAISAISTLAYPILGDINIIGKIANQGQNLITSLALEYSIDGGTPVSQNFTGLNMPFGNEQIFTFSTPWQPADTGSYNLEFSVVSVNGSADGNNTNNIQQQTMFVRNGAPTIVDNYVTYADSNRFLVVANSTDGVSTPRDLDFHPELDRNELWIINKETENTGGKTVTLFDAGKPTQKVKVIQDGNAWHFMSLPTGIAFGENTNFATSPGVADANHQGGTFTGPTLWSSDTTIYGIIGNPPTQAFNGSHLDMLHGSPFSMGIAHERDNVYWIYDSHYEELVRYDFVDDHGPGQHYHGDALVRRYREIELTRNNTQVPCHMVVDKATGWLYIADNPNKRILRVNIFTGELKTSIPLINEGLTEHSEYHNVTWEVFVNSGLSSPSGVEVVGDRLLVGDYATGNIHIYDISGAASQEIGVISTGANELMGIKVGPDGFIWYVDAGTNEVKKIETYVPEDPGPPIGIATTEVEAQFQVYPQPAQNQLTINTSFLQDNYTVTNLYNMFGQVIKTAEMKTGTVNLDISQLMPGTYIVEVAGETKSQRKPILIVR